MGATGLAMSRIAGSGEVLPGGRVRLSMSPVMGRFVTAFIGETKTREMLSRVRIFGLLPVPTKQPMAYRSPGMGSVKLKVVP